jgi:hypothetical protein
MQQRVFTGLDVFCMLQTHDMKICCCYGLLRHLDTELLNASLVHNVGTAKEVQWIEGRLRIANSL